MERCKMNTKDFPHDKGLDNTLDVLLKEGYAYILNNKEKLDSNVFDTRLLGEKTICLSGSEAAELFYDNAKFTRKNAMPNRVLNTLFGQGGVQTLNEEAHRHRKDLFLPLLSKESIQAFQTIANQQWKQAIDRWQEEEEIVFYTETQEILTRIACEWMGIPVEEEDYPKLAEDLTNMFEAAAKVGPAHHAGKKSREKREQWLKDFVHEIRNGERSIPEQEMLHSFVFHKDLEGKLLSEETVAVEILNILRPMVAISVYMNFVALALHDFPEQKEKVRQHSKEYQEHFVEEVRRYYPFFPFAGARVKEDFTWKGYHFPKDTLTLLDLYGTNHDKDLWGDPDAFRPERFEESQDKKYALIPQGGGDYATGHRCPGELVTVEMMRVALDQLVNHMDYTLPEQDLSFSLTDMPSKPKDLIRMSYIQPRSL